MPEYFQRFGSGWIRWTEEDIKSMGGCVLPGCGLLLALAAIGSVLQALGVIKERPPTPVPEPRPAVEQSSKLPDPTSGGADIRTISSGEEVDIRTHLAKGKYTLFEFYADW